MIILKWIAYILALGAFIWYVFLRGNELRFDKNSTRQQDANSQLESQLSDYSEEYKTIDTFKYSADNDIYFSEDTSESIACEEVDSPYKETEVATEESLAPSVETILQEEAVNESLNTQAPFLLVVGSFGKKSNASRLLKKVKIDYPQSTISMLNGLNRVIVSSYENKESAEIAKIQYIKNTGGSAFVLAQ